MAHISEWRVRETTTTTGTSDLVLDGAMQGSLPFQNASVMTVGDTCDYVVHYDTVFEAGLGTMAADGKLTRTTVYRSRHFNGTIDANKVSLPSGVKTVIMSARASKMVRVDRYQAFTAPETAQARANAPPFESGTRLVFQQTTVPVGWTKDTTTHNDALLRFTTGTVGSSGTVAVSAAFGSSGITETGNFQLLETHLPAHMHPAGSLNHDDEKALFASRNVVNNTTDSPLDIAISASTDTGQPIAGNTGLIGGNTPHAHPLDLRVKYADVVIGVAN